MFEYKYISENTYPRVIEEMNILAKEGFRFVSFFKESWCTVLMEREVGESPEASLRNLEYLEMGKPFKKVSEEQLDI